MKELRRKQQFKKILYSWPSLVILLIITGFLIKGALGIVMIERENAKRVVALENKSLELKQKQDELHVEVARLQSEDGIIDEIRDKFSVVREGEYVAIILDESIKASTTEPESESWYVRLLDVIIFWK